MDRVVEQVSDTAAVTSHELSPRSASDMNHAAVTSHELSPCSAFDVNHVPHGVPNIDCDVATEIPDEINQSVYVIEKDCIGKSGFQ